MALRGLFLYGAKCDQSIWERMKESLSSLDIDYISYPHEVLQKARDISDVAKWVYESYGYRDYDFIVGHSMGGQIALKLVSAYAMQPTRIILVESNPKPSGSFYRNLMTEKHMKQYSEPISRMFQNESAFYNRELLSSLQDDYDLTPCIRTYHGTIYSVYGDRGQPKYEDRINDLYLPPDIIKMMKIIFIKDAGHLPMIENPSALCTVICSIVTGRL